MSCPGNIEALLTLARNADSREILLDEIIEATGGDCSEWGTYLRGPRAAACISAANGVLEIENLAIVSRGHGTETYAVVTVAEAKARMVVQRMARADQHIINARDAVLDILSDPRTSDRRRGDARAWIQLFQETETQQALLILREYADELCAKGERLMLVKSEPAKLAMQ